mmetsp:Transcript_83734/g.175165  ORF Transcript_83734/g.175165 Transcript_83734/m.175165 type:complete len:194 (-) Transcript_83734:60-641(-)
MALRRASSKHRHPTAPRSPKLSHSAGKPPAHAGPPTVESIIVHSDDPGNDGIGVGDHDNEENALQEREEYCATKIQAWHRGKRARSEVARKRLLQKDEEDRETADAEAGAEAVAIKIQSVHRGRAARSQLQRQATPTSAAHSAAAQLVAGAATAAKAATTPTGLAAGACSAHVRAVVARWGRSRQRLRAARTN